MKQAPVLIGWGLFCLSYFPYFITNQPFAIRLFVTMEITVYFKLCLMGLKRGGYDFEQKVDI